MAACMEFVDMLCREVIREESGGYTSSGTPRRDKPSLSKRTRYVRIKSGGSGLKDVKFSDAAGGYQYANAACLDSRCRSRTIYWWTSDNELTLREESLDYNLTSADVIVSFSDSPVLGRSGVSVFEVDAAVWVLVVTSHSLHRLIFPHPDVLEDEIGNTHEVSISSIFTDSAIERAQDRSNIYVFGGAETPTGCAIEVQACAMIVTQSQEAIFVLASRNSASLFVVSMPPYGKSGGVVTREIKPPMMSRLWGGLPSLLSRGGGNQEGYTATSLCLVADSDEQSAWIVVACRDNKLRVWATASTELVCTIDPLENAGIVLSEREANGGQLMVKKSDEMLTEHGVHIAVHMSFASGHSISVYRLIVSSAVELVHVFNFCIKDDVVDYCISAQYVWTLSAGAQGEADIRYISLKGDSRSQQWMRVLSSPAPDQELDPGRYLDPREVYIDYVFYPGRFSLDVIGKALNIYRRATGEDTQFRDTSVDSLKVQVCNVVEAEIRRNAGEYEMDEAEFKELQCRQWARYYSCVLQYHQRAAKLQGLLVDGATGFIALMRKGGSLSYVRQCEPIENLYHAQSSGVNNLEACIARIYQGGSEGDISDMVDLCMYVQSVEELMGVEEAYCYEQNLFHNGSPADITAQLIQCFSDTIRGRAVLEQLAGKSDSLSERFYEVAEAFIQTLEAGVIPDNNDMDQEEDDAEEVEREKCPPTISQLFSSASGVSLVCQSVRQIIQSRFSFCRNLHIVLSVFRDSHRNIQCVRLLDQVSALTQSYYLLKYCSEAVVQPVSLAIDVELNKKLLDVLNITPASPAAISLINSGDRQHTLLEVFIRMSEVALAMKSNVLQSGALLSSDNRGKIVQWRIALLSICTSLLKILWPASVQLQMPISLISLCQYGLLQHYTRLAKWCRHNQGARKFLQAIGYLHSNENEKACRGFIEAASGVLTDEFLLTVSHTTDIDHIEVIYYLRVIQLFEQLDVSDIVVSLAKTALTLCVRSEEDPHQSILWSKIFKHELQMGDNDEAYDAMLSNPDASRRKDCLRQFIVVLCERGQMTDIVKRSYRANLFNLVPDVIEILESRARSVDISKPGYYELLYAFFIHRTNYRKAANVMYEQSARLGVEPVGVTGLRRQAKSYLACINALQLLPPVDAWVLTCVDRDLNVEDLHQSEDVQQVLGSTGSCQWKAPVDGLIKKHVKTLDLSSVRKEYSLLHARLTLLEQSGASVVSILQQRSPRADETVGQLITAGLFDLAFHISIMFDLQLTSVFEGLTLKCLQLVESSTSVMSVDNGYSMQAWKWLRLNHLTASNNTATSQSITATDQAWMLLSSYLERYGDKTTRYHRAVTVKILQHGLTVPSWLVSTYKKLNPAELITLYLDYDRVEEATLLAIDYLAALLGPGRDSFDLKDYLHVGAKPVWVPYTALDQLISTLETAAKDPKYKQLLDNLQSVVDKYIKKVHDTSLDGLHLNRSATRR